MSDNYILYSYVPASWYGDLWKDAFPAGNGKVGISVYGAVKNEMILVNHCSLWHWGERNAVPPVSSAFQKTRELLLEGRYREANSLTAEALNEAGYKAELYKPCPVGDIRIDMGEETPFTGYKRSLDIESGEITVSWKFGEAFYQRNMFVSRKRDIVVIHLTASDPDKEDMTLYMQLHETYGEDTRKMEQNTKSFRYQVGECLVYKVLDEENGCFGIACKILSCNGKLRLENGKIFIKNASDTTVIFKVFGNMDTVGTEQDAINDLFNISGTYEELREEHVKEHYALFHSAEFELARENEHSRSTEETLLSAYRDGITNELCEKLWNYGRYLFISGTKPDMQPFPMYGLWGGRYSLLWSHHMANINIQMMYWHCITGGYAKYIKAVIDYYWNLLPDLRENARKIFGLDGIFLPAGTTPGYGVMNQVVPVIVNWIGGAGWIAQHMYEYYLATEDKTLLFNKILPFMEEAAMFYEQYLVWEGELCQIMPSVSPENTPANLQNSHLIHMAHANPTAKNATMDVAILKELFSNLVDICQKMGLHQEKMQLWKSIISGLPTYLINKEGAVKEWLTNDLDDFYYHRHFSHLYPVFPGREMLFSENKELQEAFKKAVMLRIQGGQSGWSLVFRSCIFARLEDADEALASLETLVRGCLTNSFFTLHNDWRHMGLTLDLDEFAEGNDKAPIQMDANIGFVNAIQEMILQYAPGRLFLLPALPNKWKRGRATRFGFFGGDLDVQWDLEKRNFSCSIRCNKKQNLKIKLPKIITGQQTWVKQERRNFEVKDIIELEVEKNEIIEIGTN